MVVRSGLVISPEAAALQQHAHMLLYARLGARRGRAGRGGKERQTDIAPETYYRPCLIHIPASPTRRASPLPPVDLHEPL